MKAAVVWEQGKPFDVVDMELPPTGPGQVRVRLAASGVCHSDLSVRDGTIAHPLPAVLGHEGAGVVVEVGEGVTRVAPGDHVILCWMPACRNCPECLAGQPYLCDQGLAEAYSVPMRRVGDTEVLAGMAVATFAEETLVTEKSAIRIDPEIPLEIAALVGCAVTTGVGAVVNTAQVEPGATVAVIGCGGVGLSVVQGARLAGASRIIAVDASAERLDIARSMGATDAVDASGANSSGSDTSVGGISVGGTVAAVRELTGGRGVDHAFEVVGKSVTIRQGFDMARRGGTLTVVGVGRNDDSVTFNAFEMAFEAKRVLGCIYGSADSERDFPRILAWHAEGRLDLGALITERITLDGVNDAFAAMEAGHGARSMIVFGDD